MKNPEVDRKQEYPTWAEDWPFPFTPMEAWYLLQGWSVKPKHDLSTDEFLELPGKLEYSDGYVMLWQR